LGLTLITGFLLLVSPADCPAQYDFCAQVGTGSGSVDLRTLHLSEDGSFIESDSVQTIGPVSSSLLVDPRGRWIHVPLGTEIGELFAVFDNDTLLSKDKLDDKCYEDSHVALAPGGTGFIGSETFDPDEEIYLRFYAVSAECVITPALPSFEFSASEHLPFALVVSQVGNCTILAQMRNVHFTYHMDPDGSISLPTPEIAWGTEREYTSQSMGISRDGRLVVSAGNGDLFDAVSLWVDADGTVMQVDTLSVDGLLAGGGIESVMISPLREWVIFHGNSSTVCWNLNPDGSFAGEKWSTDATANFGLADLSADGRVVIVGHLADGWKLSILRLSPTGDLDSVTTHETSLPHVPLKFITRRVPGDTNGDGWLDITDVVTLINHISLGTDIPNPVDFDHSDVDRDGDRDDADVQTLVDLILTQVSPLP